MTLVELVIQVAVLGLAIGGLISPEVLLAALLPVLLAGGLGVAITLATRIIGTILLLRHVGNLRALGIEGMRLAPASFLVMWMPLLTWPAWLVGFVLLEPPLSWGVWAGVAGMAVLGMLLLHELWRATAPDQMDHWRFVAASGVVVGWGVATVIDGLLPAVYPFGLVACIVLARRLESRMNDKAIVVRELGLLAARASATATAPETAESAS